MTPKEVAVAAQKDGLGDALKAGLITDNRPVVRQWYEDHPEYNSRAVRKKLNEGGEQLLADAVKRIKDAGLTGVTLINHDGPGRATVFEFNTDGTIEATVYGGRRPRNG